MRLKIIFLALVCCVPTLAQAREALRGPTPSYNSLRQRALSEGSRREAEYEEARRELTTKRKEREKEMFRRESSEQPAGRRTSSFYRSAIGSPGGS